MTFEQKTKCENPWKKEEKMPEKVNLMCVRDLVNLKVFVAAVC